MKVAQSRKAQFGQTQSRQAQFQQAQFQQAQSRQAQFGQAQSGQAQFGQAQSGQTQFRQAQSRQAQFRQAQSRQAQSGQAQFGQTQSRQAQFGQARVCGLSSGCIQTAPPCEQTELLHQQTTFVPFFQHTCRPVLLSLTRHLFSSQYTWATLGHLLEVGSRDQRN